MIYLSYLLANLAIFDARRRGLPARAGSVLARALGHAGQHARARLGRRDADQLRLAPASPPTRSRSETARPLEFGSGFLDNIPILWLVLGAVLILGALYYGIRGARSPARCSRRPPRRRRPSRPVTAVRSIFGPRWRLRRRSREPAWAQIEAQLADRIESGELRAGRAPAARARARRRTRREPDDGAPGARRALAARGLVERGVGRGTFVRAREARPRPGPVAGFSELMARQGLAAGRS